jgi:hypothetical protein
VAANVSHLDADGATVITQQDWPDAIAGATQTPKKFGFKNVGDRALGGAGVTVEIQASADTNDGNTELRQVMDTATLPGPWGVTATAAAGTGSFASGGTKGYRLTSLSALGESASAMEATVALGAVSNVVTIAWTQVPMATGYRVYRTDTPGTYGGSSRLTEISSGAQVSMADGGGPTVSGSPPADNRTAGWLTTLALSAPAAGGAWGTIGTRYWRVTALDSTGTILAASLENSVNVDNVTKTVTVSWTAIPGAATYKVYRSTASAIYTTPALVATITAPTVSYIDTGTATVAGQLTASASYGTPPAAGSFGTAALVAGTSVAINQTVFYWVNRVVPAATPEAGNPRLALTVVKET